MEKIGLIGYGWLGERLALRLISEGYSVFGTTTQSEKQKRLSISGFPTFIYRTENDSLPHSGFVTSLKEAKVVILSLPPKGLTSEEGVFHLLSKIKEDSTVIFTSSTSVYGEQKGIISEDSPESPISERAGIIKRTEILLQERFKSLFILRLGGLIGPNRNPGLFFKNNSIIPRPDKSVNMIHLEDVIGIIIQLLKPPSLPCGIYNCISPSHPTRKEFYTRYRYLTGKEPPIFGVPSAEADRLISSEKLVSILKYDFVFPDLMTLKETDF